MQRPLLSRLIRRFLGLLLLAIMMACGGGVGEDGTGAPVLAVGALTGASDTTITVNGQTFDKGEATIVDGMDNSVAFDALHPGMWVEVSATRYEASQTVVTNTIRVRPAVRGRVISADGTARTLSVLGSTIRMDTTATVLEGVDATEALKAGDLVEVHGPLGAGGGTVRASRVEKLAGAAEPSAKPFELRGRVSNLDAAAAIMTVGRQAVSFATATVVLRRALANGQVVRVTSAAPPSSGRPWAIEQLRPDQPLPEKIGFLYAEGFTDNWSEGPRFQLDDLAVDASTATGRSKITGDDQHVGVVGSLAEGTLSAKTVTLIEPGKPVVFVLAGTISKFTSLSDFVVRGIKIDASTATIVDGRPEDLADGRKVTVTGTVSGRTIVATKVQIRP